MKTEKLWLVGDRFLSWRSRDSVSLRKPAVSGQRRLLGLRKSAEVFEPTFFGSDRCALHNFQHAPAGPLRRGTVCYRAKCATSRGGFEQLHLAAASECALQIVRWRAAKGRKPLGSFASGASIALRKGGADSVGALAPGVGPWTLAPSGALAACGPRAQELTWWGGGCRSGPSVGGTCKLGPSNSAIAADA